MNQPDPTPPNAARVLLLAFVALLAGCGAIVVVALLAHQILS